MSPTPKDPAVRRSRTRWWKLPVLALGVLLPLALALAVVTVLDNRRLPRHSGSVDRLAEKEKASLSEALHLHHALGDSIWPGWAVGDPPVILYNERYAFVVGYPDPPRGWTRVPGDRTLGGPWECVPSDSFAGTPYYRQPLPDSDITPEAFTVRIGDRWAASAPTQEWIRIALVRSIRHHLPWPVSAIFPYRLALRLLVGGTDGYVCLLEHEIFHAHQGSLAPVRLAAAERAAALEGPYDAVDPRMEEAWRPELALLARCLGSATRAQRRELAIQFLAERSARRARQALRPALIDYERHREWLEGLAKYVELDAWRWASSTPGYRPFPTLAGDPGFRGYRGFDRKRSQEVIQIRWSRGDVRFYSAGLAQAMLLDSLMPGWKSRAFEDDTWLEDLVAEAVRVSGS
jgi:hypothetical protein